MTKRKHKVSENNPIKKRTKLNHDISFRRVNADASFLLEMHGMRLLVDPWLISHEIDGSALFNKANHTFSPMSCKQVMDLKIDAIVISLPFSDHCHEETLALLDHNIPIYAEKAAKRRLETFFNSGNDDNNGNSKTKRIIEIDANVGVDLEGSNSLHIKIECIQPGNVLDFTHGGLYFTSVIDGEILSTGLYAPHGLSAKQAQKLKVERLLNVHLHLLLTTMSTYELPLLLGGTVNLGLKEAEGVCKILNPQCVIDVHSEQKVTSGMVPYFANPVYPTHVEIRKAIKNYKTIQGNDYRPHRINCHILNKE